MFPPPARLTSTCDSTCSGSLCRSPPCSGSWRSFSASPICSWRDRWQLITWVGVVFISILVHELGHALAAGTAGHHPAIQLTYPGLAYFQQFRLTPWRLPRLRHLGRRSRRRLRPVPAVLQPRVLRLHSRQHDRSAAGDGQLLLDHLQPAPGLPARRRSDPARTDAGTLLPRFSPQITHRLGAIIAAVIAIFAFRSGDIFLVVMFAMFTMLNIQMLQSRRMW